ncbi:septum formation initiator family protein [Rubritalea marina]|uniref:septum formation initiator family protein n=1 Tax=Rubritalea marina TaxID=361055 RepID=UPI000376ABF4|nr:septum formation initiator family protein [Rubritalea marina]
MAKKDAQCIDAKRLAADSRMRSRTRFLRNCNVLAIYAVSLLIAGVVLAKCLPEYNKLLDQKDQLSGIQSHEQLVQEQADQQLREYRALEQDSSFLEIYGRDRLDYYKEGERVFRFSREESL